MPVSGIPLFNVEVLKSLPAADSGNVMDEALHLADELGLANAEEDLPPWDEIIFRLRHCRPEWAWKEDLNPYVLSQGARFTELTEPGIYNRAVLVAGTRSPFTYGLEMELRKLAQWTTKPSGKPHWVHGCATKAWRHPRRRTTPYWRLCR